ncbi:hypothetical protein [Sphingomonas sp. UYP23]
MAKAEWSCDECGDIYPADQFAKVTIREVSSTSSSTRVYRGTKGGLGVGGGSSTRYRHVKMKLCYANCYPAYLEMLRRQRARAIRTGIATIAIICGVIYFVLRLPTPAPLAAGNETAAIDSNAAEALPLRSSEDARNSAEPIQGDADLDTRPMAETPQQEVEVGRAPIAEEPRTTAAPSEDDRRPASGSNNIGGAIAIARIDALEAGKAIAWHADGERGFAVVSSPTATGDRTCRNVYITNDSAARSATEAWCRVGDGEWERQPG